MGIEEIQVQPRDALGTRACGRLRKEGLVPAVIYGHGEPSVSLSVSAADIERLLRLHNFILRVSWDGQSQTAQLKDIQYDPVTDGVLHVDIVRISLSETITTTVPVETFGEPESLDEGGILNVMLHEVEVECLPTVIPGNVRVDVSALGMHDTITVGELELPEGVKPTHEPETVVVVVLPPTEEAEEEEEVEEAEMLTEPELIGREEAGPEEDAGAEGD